MGQCSVYSEVKKVQQLSKTAANLIADDFDFSTVSLTENDLIFKAILTLVLDFMYILKLLVERSSVLTRQLTIKTATKIWPLNEQPPCLV